MADLKLNALNTIQLIYIDKANVVDTTVYIPQSQTTSTTIKERYGATVCGYKNKDNKGAKFYLFGGILMDNTTGDITFMNDFIKIDVTFASNGAVVSSVETITPDNTSIPCARSFAKSKMVGSFVYIQGGMDINGNPIPDHQRFSTIDNIWKELPVDGDPPSQRIFI